MRKLLLLAALAAAGCAESAIDEVKPGQGDAASAGDSAESADSATAAEDSMIAADSGGGAPDTTTTSGGGLHIERAYGNGTSLMGSWGAGVTLGVRVVDGAGNPASGVPIAWSSRTGDFAYFPAASGATTLTVPTDADGWSTPSINAPNPPMAVTESLLTAKLGGESRDFYVQTTNNGDASGPMGQQAFTGPDNANHSALGPYTVGSVIPNALVFDVVCNNPSRCPGVPLKNVSVRINLPDASSPYGKSDPKLDPPVECVGIEPLADDKGHIRCDLKIKRKFAGTIRAAVGQFVEFEYTLTAN